MVIGIKPMKLTIIDYFVPETLKRTQPVSLYYNFFFLNVYLISDRLWGEHQSWWLFIRKQRFTVKM